MPVLIGFSLLVVFIGVLHVLNEFTDNLGEHGNASSRSETESRDKNVYINGYGLRQSERKKLDSILESNDYTINSPIAWIERVYRNERALMLFDYTVVLKGHQLVLPNLVRSNCTDCQNEFRFSLDRISDDDYVDHCPFYAVDPIEIGTSAPDSILIYIYKFPSEDPVVDSLMLTKVN